MSENQNRARLLLLLPDDVFQDAVKGEVEVAVPTHSVRLARLGLDGRLQQREIKGIQVGSHPNSGERLLYLKVKGPTHDTKVEGRDTGYG